MNCFTTTRCTKRMHHPDHSNINFTSFYSLARMKEFPLFLVRWIHIRISGRLEFLFDVQMIQLTSFMCMCVRLLSHVCLFSVEQKMCSISNRKIRPCSFNFNFIERQILRLWVIDVVGFFCVGAVVAVVVVVRSNNSMFTSFSWKLNYHIRKFWHFFRLLKFCRIINCNTHWLICGVDFFPSQFSCHLSPRNINNLVQ